MKTKDLFNATLASARKQKALAQKLKEEREKENLKRENKRIARNKIRLKLLLTRAGESLRALTTGPRLQPSFTKYLKGVIQERSITNTIESYVPDNSKKAREESKEFCKNLGVGFTRVESLKKVERYEYVLVLTAPAENENHALAIRCPKKGPWRDDKPDLSKLTLELVTYEHDMSTGITEIHDADSTHERSVYKALESFNNPKSIYRFFIDRFGTES